MHKHTEPTPNPCFTVNKCRKVNNPCKICWQTVTKRNGLQCRGACKKWAHYKCLGYTPGKIHDIKAGLITVVCPCPDCCSGPKEICTNPPTTCPETDCPANNSPKCESNECPKNKALFSCQCVNPSILKKPCKEMFSPCPSPLMASKETSAWSSRTSCSQGESKHVICKPVTNCKPIQVTISCSGSSSSDSQLCYNDHHDNVSGSMINALERLCQTVTHLSDQIKMIICKMSN